MGDAQNFWWGRSEWLGSDGGSWPREREDIISATHSLTPPPTMAAHKTENSVNDVLAVRPTCSLSLSLYLSIGVGITRY